MPRDDCKQSKAVTDHHQRLESPLRESKKDNDYLCVLNHVSRAKYLAQLQFKVSTSVAHNLQASSVLLSVTQFNTMRAMVANAETMGLSLQILCEDIASFFNISGPSHGFLQLPPSLQPSSAQKQIIHHPWIDLLPIESLRNSLLSQLDVYDEDELCTDFYGMCGPSAEAGLIVWGESWDPSAYEISEGFFRKWSWLLKDCTDLIQSTNYWRKKRGEKPLKLEPINDRIKEVE